jgi:hypothetical protein
MSAECTIAILLGRGRGGLAPLNPAEWKCLKARVGWVRATVDALREAQRQLDKRCDAAVNRVSEKEFQRIFDEEHAKVEAIRADIVAVIERDEWPRDLSFAGI